MRPRKLKEAPIRPQNEQANIARQVARLVLADRPTPQEREYFMRMLK